MRPVLIAFCWYNGTPYLIFSSPTRRRRAGEKFFLGTEIHGFIFNKGTAWLRIDIYPRHFVITACFASSRLSFPLWALSTEFFVHRLSQINTDFLISKDILIITDYYHLIRAFGSKSVPICVNLWSIKKHLWSIKTVFIRA